MHASRSLLVTRWGLRALVTVLAAGFLAMHGFLAVLSPEAHAAPAVEPHGGGGGATHGAHVADAGVDGVTHRWDGRAPASPPGPAGGGHAPPEHHQLLTGCVVALAGVTALGILAPLLLRRHRTTLDGSCRRGTDAGLLLCHATPRPRSGWPRIALCVTRV